VGMTVSKVNSTPRNLIPRPQGVPDLTWLKKLFRILNNLPTGKFILSDKNFKKSQQLT
jgi:hypothetical protein